MAPDGLFAAYKEVLDEHGILFISDEVQTGWGRTGAAFWGCQTYGVQPDIVAMAKGITSGHIPLGAAGVIPGMSFDNVRQHSLEWIWRESAAFQRFRGEQWMPEPCRSCERRAEDFGGCRCQAFLLTGDANATDPVCTLAPTHHLVETARETDTPAESKVSWSYRTNP